MRIRPDHLLWQSIRSERNGALAQETVEKQIWALSPRAQFTRSYQDRGGRDSNGQKLDPVLAFHLGLTDGE